MFLQSLVELSKTNDGFLGLCLTITGVTGCAGKGYLAKELQDSALAAGLATKRISLSRKGELSQDQMLKIKKFDLTIIDVANE